MLHSTKGLVLRQTRYGESSLIVSIYTESFGRQSYIISGVRSARSRTKAALFQPPNLLSLVVYHQESRDLQRIREAQPLHLYERIPFQIGHSSVALFMTEVLSKCLRAENAQEELFVLVEHSLLSLDACRDGLKVFPLRFLLSLSRSLGFEPQGKLSKELPWFDLHEGYYVNSRPAHGQALHPEEAALMHGLRPLDQDQPDYGLPTPALRQALLEKLLLYFRFHVEGFGQLRSAAILHEVLGGKA